ncbi:MAG: RHS repeat protein, partial [Actinomycetia bacterium]|nr:RHS repeat protein [Actinomycetes bacterium]
MNLYTADTDPSTGIRTATTRAPHGGETLSVTDPVLRRRATTAPDGTTTLTETLPSAVPSGAAPDSRAITTLPSGLARTRETRGTWTLADPQDPESRVLTRQVSEANGATWSTEYDPATRTRTTSSAEGRTAETVIDALDRPVQTRTSGLSPIEYRYDARGLLIETRQGEGAGQRITRYAYNALDHLQGTTDAEGRTTGYHTDELGRVTAITRPDGQITHFAYDAKGNLLSLTPPGRPEHQMQYTPVDLETGYTPPAIPEQTGPIATAYNKDRDLTAREHALGPAIGYGYDAAARLISRTTPEGETRYSYAGNTARIASITTPSGERLDLGYDGPLRIASQWTGTINGDLAGEWNNDFRLAAHTLNGQYRIDYRYGRDGLLTRAGDLQLIRHAGHGAVTATTLGGLATERGYNGFGETLSDSARFNASPLYQVQYSRDKLGRITRKTETLDGQSHAYDYRYDAA